MLYPSTSQRLANSSAPRPAPILILDMMGETEARETVNRINGKAGEMGRLLLDLKQREGWRALGYSSWTQCLQCEFEYSRNHLYELMRAAPVMERLQPKGITLNTAQAEALSQYPPELQLPIVETTKARYGKLTESTISRVGDAFTQIVATGYLNTGDGETSTAFEGHMTRMDEEAMLQQKQHIADNGKKRDYLIKHEELTTDGGGRLLLSGLPKNVKVYVSVWVETE